MRFDVITLFPELIDTICSASIIGRAEKKGILSVFSHNIRDYSGNARRNIDDTPYGGGMGMLIQAPPVVECHTAVKNICDMKTHTVYMSPSGKVLSQKKALELASYERLIIICGHYEGIDRRAIELTCDEEISVGDYVLTGGELPACILIDCVGRTVEGVLASSECHEIESISCGMLEYPQYTKPREYKGLSVPDVLLGGNDKEIAEFRFRSALELTKKNRPDML